MHQVIKTVCTKLSNTFDYIDSIHRKRESKNNLRNVITVCCLKLLNNESYESTINDLYINNNIEKTSRQSITKYRSKIDSFYFEIISKTMSELFNKRYNKGKYYAVDASTIKLSKKQAKNGFNSTKSKRYCNGSLTSIYDIENGTIVSTKLSPCHDERKYFLNRVKELDKNGMYIFDRGYASVDFIETLISESISFCSRLKEKETFVKDYFPKVKEDTVVNIDYKHSNGKIIKLRGIIYFIEKQPYYLLTPDTNHTLQQLKDLYHGRWSIEEYFKIIKAVYRSNKYLYTDENLIRQDIQLTSFMHNFVRFFQKLSLEFNNVKNTVIPHNSLVNFIHKTTDKKTFKINYTSSANNIIDNIFPMLFVSNKYNCRKVTKIMEVVRNTCNKIIPGRHFGRFAVFPLNKWYDRYYMVRYNPP